MTSRADRDASVYAPPRLVTDLSACSFYHTMSVPGYGVVKGQWDLTHGVDSYLGRVDVAGKRVLEIGTADGYLTFCMERRGAEVVSFDLSEEHQWDVVPFARAARTNGVGRPSEAAPDAIPSWLSPDKSPSLTTMRRLNNAYWLCHRAFESRAQLVNGTVYDVPSDIGLFDVSVFGAILLHTRDPFAALVSPVRLTRETVIVTDALGLLALPQALRRLRSLLPQQLRRPPMRFMPDWRTAEGPDGWWRLSPEIVVAFLGVLGFEQATVTTHTQLYNGKKRRLFTVVAQRTVAGEVDDLT